MREYDGQSLGVIFFYSPLAGAGVVPGNWYYSPGDWILQTDDDVITSASLWNFWDWNAANINATSATPIMIMHDSQRQTFVSQFVVIPTQ